MGNLLDCFSQIYELEDSEDESDNSITMSAFRRNVRRRTEPMWELIPQPVQIPRWAEPQLLGFRGLRDPRTHQELAPISAEDIQRMVEYWREFINTDEHYIQQLGYDDLTPYEQQQQKFELMTSRIRELWHDVVFDENRLFIRGVLNTIQEWQEIRVPNTEIRWPIGRHHSEHDALRRPHPFTPNNPQRGEQYMTYCDFSNGWIAWRMLKTWITCDTYRLAR